MVKVFCKKPIRVEALRYEPILPNVEEILRFAEGCVVLHGDEIWIATLEGTMCAKPGDWIIKSVKGEFYPCKNDIFEATYEETTGG